MSRSKQLSAPHDHADQGDLKQTDSSTLSPQSSKSLVVLFKNREEGADVDPYTSAFEKKGLGEPIFVPVLKTGSENEERLQKVLRSGCGDGAPYGCVIVTSARAAEMWIRAAINLHTTNEGERSGPTSPNGHAGWVDWRAIPFYVVGDKTSRVLKGSPSSSLPSLPKDSPLQPTLLLGAEQSGTGAKLAEFILQDYPARFPASPEASAIGSTEARFQSQLPPLLYLTGDKNAGTLLATLAADPRMHVQTLQVYRTWSRSAEEFEQEFKDLEKTVDDSLPVNNADGGSNRDIQPQQMMERVSFDHATAQGPHTVSSISSELDSLSLDSSSLAPNTIGREEVIFDLWFALFAPSAARAVLPIARRHFSLPPNHVTHSHTRQTPDDEHTDNRAPLAGSPGTEAIAVTNSEPDAGKLNHPNPHNIHQGNAPTPFPSSLSSSSSSSRPSTSFTAAPLSGSSSTNSPLSAVPASPLSGSPWPEVTVRERVFSLPLGDAASTPNAAGVGARVRVAAIGPTTAAFLSSDAEDAGIYVEVVPEKPTPDCLAESIWQASRSKEPVGR